MVAANFAIFCWILVKMWVFGTCREYSREVDQAAGLVWESFYSRFLFAMTPGCHCNPLQLLWIHADDSSAQIQTFQSHIVSLQALTILYSKQVVLYICRLICIVVFCLSRVSHQLLTQHVVSYCRSNCTTKLCKIWQLSRYRRGLFKSTWILTLEGYLSVVCSLSLV